MDRKGVQTDESERNSTTFKKGVDEKSNLPNRGNVGNGATVMYGEDGGTGNISVERRMWEPQEREPKRKCGKKLSG